MTDPTIGLGGKRSAGAAMIDARVAALERTIQQIPSRFPNRSPSLSRVVTQAGHGFVFQDVIARDAANTWDLADASDLYEPIGIVTQVLSVDTFVVALRGYFHMPGLIVPGTASAVTDWTTYFLHQSTLGDIGDESSLLNPPAVKRAVLTTLDQGWVEVHGLATDMHDHYLGDARDYDDTAAFLGCVPTFDPDAFGTGIAGYKPKTITGALGDRTALSVIGNPTNASTSATDIAAGASAFTVLNCNGTVLQWTQIGTAYIADGAITAVKLGSDVTLEALQDVAIVTSPDARVADDFLTWDGTAWVNRNLGAIICVPASTAMAVLALDGGVSGTPTACGIAATGSRLVVGNTATCIDFIQSGTVGSSSDVCLRWLNNGATMEWRDLASGAPGTGTAGDKVAEWLGSATPSSRYFGWRMEQRWYDQTSTAGAGSHYLQLKSTAAQAWTLNDDLGVRFFKFLHTDGNVAGSGASINVFDASLILNSQPLYFGAVTSSGTDSQISGTNAALTVLSATITLTSSTAINIGTTGSPSINIGIAGGVSGGVGFFSHAVARQQSLNANITLQSPAAAATYTQADIQKMVNDITNLVAQVNAARTGLLAFGLFA